MRLNDFPSLAAFSPDSRVLLTADGDGIHLWEVATWGPIGGLPWRMPGPAPQGRAAPIASLAFMPSGRDLATGMPDGTILIWDLSPKMWSPTAVANDGGGKDLKELWDYLADPDAGKAYRAIYSLAAAPDQAIPCLAERLSQPLPEPDLKRVPQFIADLDNNSSRVRAAATQNLAQLGHLAEPDMRRALKGKPTNEARVRLESLLTRLHGLPLPPETVRAARAIQVLEWIGSDAARQVLEKLSKGVPKARQTQDAKASLERLGKRTAITDTSRQGPKAK
jgi:hypothetical protein